MRKLLIVALAALTSIALASVAIAQTPDVESTASLTPSKAGTKSKPKPVRFKTFVKNNVPNTTASKIEILVPKTVKVSGKGLTNCPVTEFSKPGGKANCPSASKAGTGLSHAVVGPDRAALDFNVTAYVGGNSSIIFYIEQIGGENRKVLIGKISTASGKYSQKITITIPPELQQPAPNLYGALTDLRANLYNKKGSKSLFSSVDCKSKKHNFGAKLTFVNNPAPPPKTSASGTTIAKCSS